MLLMIVQARVHDNAAPRIPSDFIDIRTRASVVSPTCYTLGKELERMADKTARLTIDDVDMAMPVISGTEGPDVIDVGKLTAQGYFTYDPGFVSTAACESAITYIDGDAGVLLHRGYPIEQLAERSDYLEVCYLLLNGELPNSEEKASFVDTIKRHTMVHDQLRNFFNGFRRDAHPMAIMCGVVGALSAFYHDSLDIDGPPASSHHRPPLDRQDAHPGGNESQVFARRAVHVPGATTCLTRPTSCR